MSGGIELNKIYPGNTLEVLKTFPSDYFDTIITSPPYWGLRDYGDETKVVWDGDPDCEHEWGTDIAKHDNLRQSKVSDKTAVGSNKNLEFRTGEKVESGFCKKCGAWYGQLGLEPTLELYLEHMLQITAELKRVLKPTGVMFWNQGDSYGSHRSGESKIVTAQREGKVKESNPLKGYEKSLILQNYRLIFRMVDEQGWTLRNNIIWHKPNHMPSSVKDRFTNAYEPVFMLTKKKKYWFDLDAVRVPHTTHENRPMGIVRNREYGYDSKLNTLRGRNKTKDETYKKGGMRNAPEPTEPNAFNPLGKNPGDVWAIPTQPFPEAHFAVFPEKLIEPMIKSACPQWVCKKCGKPRERITEVVGHEVTDAMKVAGSDKNGNYYGSDTKNYTESLAQSPSDSKRRILESMSKIKQTVGWTDCGCNAGWAAGVVLDPFMGSGTTARVALKNARNFVGIDANSQYVDMANVLLEPYIHIKRLDKFMGEIE